MTKSIWVKLDAARFLTDEDVVEMSLAEVGLYIKLLCYGWLNNGIPAEPDRLARALQLDLATFEQSWKAVSRCWQPNSETGRLHNSRQEAERAAMDNASFRNQRGATTRRKPAHEPREIDHLDYYEIAVGVFREVNGVDRDPFWSAGDALPLIQLLRDHAEITAGVFRGMVRSWLTSSDPFQKKQNFGWFCRNAEAFADKAKVLDEESRQLLESAKR